MNDEQKALQRLIGMFCNAVDNLSDMPVSQEWAAGFAKEGMALLEANDYFRASRLAAAARELTNHEIEVIAHAKGMSKEWNRAAWVPFARAAIAAAAAPKS